MIKAKISEVVAAFTALRKLNEEIRLGQDPAWKMAAMLRHLKPTVEDYETVQLKLYKDAGGVESGNGIQMNLEPQGDEEKAEDFAARRKAFIAMTSRLNDELREMGKREVEIERDPLTLAMFTDPPNTPDDRKMTFNPNWLADAGPFLTE